MCLFGKESHLIFRVAAIRAVRVSLHQLPNGQTVRRFVRRDGDVLAHRDRLSAKKITIQGIFCSAARFRQANKLHRIVKCDRSKRNQRMSLTEQKQEIETKKEHINMQLKLIRKNLGQTFASSSNANIPEGDVTTTAGRLCLRQRGLPVKLAVLLAGLLVQVALVSAQSQNVVVDWNRNLLVIVRTHGAQPATIHPTRSFAMMHAAIYDAVN